MDERSPKKAPKDSKSSDDDSDMDSSDFSDSDGEDNKTSKKVSTERATRALFSPAPVDSPAKEPSNDVVMAELVVPPQSDPAPAPAPAPDAPDAPAAAADAAAAEDAALPPPLDLDLDPNAGEAIGSAAKPAPVESKDKSKGVKKAKEVKAKAKKASKGGFPVRRRHKHAVRKSIRNADAVRLMRVAGIPRANHGAIELVCEIANEGIRELARVAALSTDGAGRKTIKDTDVRAGLQWTTGLKLY